MNTDSAHEAARYLERVQRSGGGVAGRAPGGPVPVFGPAGNSGHIELCHRLKPGMEKRRAALAERRAANARLELGQQGTSNVRRPRQASGLLPGYGPFLHGLAAMGGICLLVLLLGYNGLAALAITAPLFCLAAWANGRKSRREKSATGDPPVAASEQ